MNDQILERAGSELISFLTEGNPYRSLLILVASLLVESVCGPIHYFDCSKGISQVRQ